MGGWKPMKFFTKLLFVIPLFFIPVLGAFAYTDNNIVIVRIMDKAAGKTQLVKIPVGENVQVDKLSVLTRSCKKTDPFQAEDFFAFIEIQESDKGKIFSGWMSRNNPGQNPLQNPDYDLWVVGCE